MLQNLNFRDNQKDEKIGKPSKVTSVINHFSDSFSVCAFNDSTQPLMNTWSNLTKDQAWGSTWRMNQCNGSLNFDNAVQLRQDIYTSLTCTLVTKKTEKINLDPLLFLPWQNALQTCTVPFSLIVSSTVHPLSSRFSTKAFTELLPLE